MADQRGKTRVLPDLFRKEPTVDGAGRRSRKRQFIERQSTYEARP